MCPCLNGEAWPQQSPHTAILRRHYASGSLRHDRHTTICVTTLDRSVLVELVLFRSFETRCESAEREKLILASGDRAKSVVLPTSIVPAVASSGSHVPGMTRVLHHVSLVWLASRPGQADHIVTSFLLLVPADAVVVFPNMNLTIAVHWGDGERMRLVTPAPTGTRRSRMVPKCGPSQRQRISHRITRPSGRTNKEPISLTSSMPTHSTMRAARSRLRPSINPTGGV